MNIFTLFYMFVLFVLLTPGILLTLPPKGSKWSVAIVHGLVFTLVWWFTHKFVWALSMNMMAPTVVVAV